MIVVTGNAPAFRHFIELRASPAAHTEVRRLAISVLRLMQQEAPHLYDDYQIGTTGDGEEFAETEYSSV
jgi:thymidylate synthase (FAD)